MLLRDAWLFMQVKNTIKKVVWSPASLRTLSALLLPFRVLYRSHIYYVLYLLFATYCLIYISETVMLYFDQWLETLVDEYPVSMRFWGIASNTGASLIYALVIPVLLAIAAAPVRHVYFYNKIRPALLTGEIPTAIKNTVQCTIITAVRLTLATIPVIVLVLGYYYWAAEAGSKSIPQVYIVTASFVSIVLIMHQVPLIVAPLLSAVAGLNPFYALAHASHILNRSRFKIFLLLVLMAGACLLSKQFLLEQSYIRNKQFAFQVAVLFWAWYFLNHLFHLLLLKTIWYQQQIEPGGAGVYYSSNRPVHTIENVEIQ